jgi:metal iron transporter
MPHSLYLGSGIVQSRLRQFDIDSTDPAVAAAAEESEKDDSIAYQPSIGAIRSCLRYSVAEIAISLFTFALFVNSSILIVAGASLSGTSAADASLFGIHDLLSETIAPAAGTLFAVALLLSGMSAGVVCTMAGQMVSEGQLNLHWPRWAQRLFTRGLSIIPSIIIAGALGQDGLNTALEASQVTLSVLLPFVSAPLIWFTCRERYMKVSVSGDRLIRFDDSSLEGTSQSSHQVVADAEENVQDQGEYISMANGWPTTIIAVVLWGIIVFMNMALIVLAGLGIDA